MFDKEDISTLIKELTSGKPYFDSVKAESSKVVVGLIHSVIHSTFKPYLTCYTVSLRDAPLYSNNDKCLTLKMIDMQGLSAPITIQIAELGSERYPLQTTVFDATGRTIDQTVKSCHEGDQFNDGRPSMTFDVYHALKTGLKESGFIQRDKLFASIEPRRECMTVTLWDKIVDNVRLTVIMDI